MTNFYFNLTEKLQGCSKQKGMVVCTSNPDGQPTVNRQSAMTLLSGKKAEKEQLSSTCLRSASYLPPFRSRYLRYAAMIFAVLVMSMVNIGMAWGETVTATYSHSSSTLQPVSFTSNAYFDAMTIATSGTVGGSTTTGARCNLGGNSTTTITFTFTAKSSFNISGFSLSSYVNSNDVKTAVITYKKNSESPITVTPAIIFTKDSEHADDATMASPISMNDEDVFTVSVSINNSTGTNRMWVIHTITLNVSAAAPASSARTYDGTEKMYFLRDAWSWWNNDGVKFFAYFWNSSTDEHAWSEAASWAVQTTSGSKDVWAYTVPAGAWTHVQITRHPSGTTTPTMGNRTNWSNDITLEATTNLLTNWTVMDQDNTGHSITWSNITLDGKKVYFDNRNYPDWTSAYVRIGHSSSNSAWGPMTLVAGTRNLYEYETDQWDYHTNFSVANSYGWTGSNNIYQPWEGQDWSAPAKITKQTTYQKYGIARDVYLCPTSTSMLERECQYYNVNGGTSTNTFEDVSTGVSLPSYTVTTTSATNCTVTLQKCTNYGSGTYTDLSSGGTVLPTQYVKVTVTPDAGYQFSSVEVTGAGTVTAAASGTPGVYYITGDATITATCTAKTCTVTFDKEGGSSGSDNATATYDSAMPTITAPTKTGYTFGGYWDGDNGTGTQYYKADGTSKKNWDKDVTATQTLYAKWTVNSHTLTWNWGGGSTSATEGTNYTAGGSVNYGTTLTYPENNTMSKTGYNFTGWSSSPSTMPDENLTITAQWSQIMVSSVSLNKASTTIIEGGTETLTATVLPAEALDKAVTWSTSDGDVATVDGGVVTAVAAGTATITAAAHDGSGKSASCTVTVTPAVTYTVTYDYQGATGGNGTVSNNGNPLPNPSKTGYSFAGWYASDGTFAGAGGATSYVPTADITLYAQWQSTTCAGGGGGSSTVYSMTLSGTNGETDVTITQSTAGVASISHQLDNSTPMDVGGLKYFKFNSSSSITINYTFAVGDKLVFDICSKDNNKNCGVYVKVGSADAVAVTGTTNQTPSTLEYTMSSAGSQTIIITRAGIDASAMRLHGISIVRSGGGGTCYYVTYNGNGADGGYTTDEASHASGSNVTVASNSFTKTGYRFTGWKTEPSGGTSYDAGGTISSIAGNMTLYAQWVEAATPTLYTVTFNSNGGSSVSPVTQASAGASIAKPSDPTRASYSFDGWYKTDGTKVDWSYTPTADITLYARWQKACDAGAGSVATFNFNSGSESGLTIESNGANASYSITNEKYNNIPALDSYFLGTSFTGNASGIITITTNTSYTDIDSIKFNSAATDNADPNIAIFTVSGETETKQQNAFALSSGSTKKWRDTPYKKDLSSSKPDGKVRFKLTTGGSGKHAGIDNIQIFYGGGSGTCRHIYYHGNGATSGFVSDTTSYADDAKATVLSYNDSRYPLTKDGYDFQGWATIADGAVAYTAGEKITIDGADVHLYAVWAAESSALVTWKMKTADDEAWATTTGTGTTDGTNITSISTAHDEGDDKAKNSATAKTALASSASNVDKGADFTFAIGSTKQVEINKLDCQVFNVGGDNDGQTTYKAQISDAAGNVYTSTNSVCPANDATLTDASFVFGSGKILRGAVTIRVYGWVSGSGSWTDFRMGPDVKFYGTVGDYSCATPAAPTISGVSEYVPGQTITLTASHDGENYDNLTTYTWYKGDTWGSKSQVQAAATGSAGYTFTKDPCAADDAGKYWCEVANGTCNAHNSEGYNIIVYPTYTITYNLNEGAWGEVEHKDSYTQFDEDYTLPTPTKTGSVFAGWYGTSDFSGLPTVVLGSGSVGDKVYYAKWGEVVTVSWTVTKRDDKLYRGGGGYSVKAVIDQTTWDESYKDQLELTATEGVTLKNIVASVVSSHVQVTADFDITTGLAADATEITFTLNVPAAGTYGPKVDEHEEDLTSCAGGSTTITIFDGATMSDKTDADDISYKSGTEYTDGTTGFKYKCAGFKKDLVDVTEYTNHGSYSNAMKYGGNSTSYYISMTIPTGYTGSMEIVYGSTDKTKYFAFGTSNSSTANGSNGTKWNATTAAATTLYSATIDDLAAGTYYLLATGDKAIVAKIAMTLYATGGGITPTLTWDDGDADIANDGVSKSTSNDDFVYTASQDKNSLGVITYSSSDATVATVNATTGQVHLVGAAGTATITATIAASGCFSSANVSYPITVTDDCDDEAGTITTEDFGCSGIKMTVTGHTAAAGVMYQWYKVGTPSDAEVGTNQDNFTATEAGSYYVIVTNTGDRHCAKRSTNTITVEAQAAATATKIVDSWYVKNGRRTPDIELVKTTNATSFTVTNGSSTIWESAGSTKTGFGGCGFHMDENGIIYLNGTKDGGAATTGLTAGDETLTITAIGCGGNASQNITIHKQAATDYKEIAFVADGGKGMKKDSITVGHGDGTELYEYLDSVGTAAENRLFKLSERNIYWTTDEKVIREEYSQFDAILITDDPSTNTVVKKGDDYKTKGYVNAFGTMVDVRPIFTMEAYVSALKNWGSKGIKGSPESPNPRQYEMRLECKDHEIYGAGLPDPEDGTNVWEEVIDYETFRHVILVDSTKGIYKGVAYNAETAGKDKPALQGFTGEAAGSLLGLGRISNGTLQAAIERQEEPAARLLVMGINAKALQPTCALTNEGKTVIKNILIYLLKTNMEEVDDCSNYFTGKNSSDWNNASNWSKNQLPSSEAKVRILAPCEISGIQPHVAQVAIVSSGESGIRETATGSANCNGQLTINADGALIVDGKVLAADAPHFAANDLMPTTPEMLTINTGSDGQAALIFNNEEGLTKATVNYYSLGRKEGNAYQFQYFAVPMEYVDVNPAFAGSGIYTYVWHENGGWERRGYYTELYAFEGVGITTKFNEASHNYTMKGTLASTAEREVTLTNDAETDAAGKGDNIIGNSWMAPIDIASLKTAIGDDSKIEKVVYIYCTGNDKTDGDDDVDNSSTETAGQWLSIPIEASAWEGWSGLKVIPAMQAFLIHVTDESSLTLNYDTLVRSTATDKLNEKLRAPRRKAVSENGFSGIRMSVADSQTHTDLYLFEGKQFSADYDNGWEAKYMEGDGRSAQFYAMNGADKMAVLATDELEGTPVCFVPGKESNYTISFFGGEGNYYLNDLKEEKSTLMEQGNTYSFTYEQGDMPHRFLISTTPFGIPSVTTGIGGVGAQEKVQKVIYNDHVYIIRGGKIYDVMGKMMK